MPTDSSVSWDERRQALLSDLCELIYDLDQGKLPSVSTDIHFSYVHFFNEDGEDIGNLPIGTAFHALNSNVWLWSECSTEEDPETGEAVADLDIKEAVRLDLSTH